MELIDDRPRRDVPGHAARHGDVDRRVAVHEHVVAGRLGAHVHLEVQAHGELAVPVRRARSA